MELEVKFKIIENDKEEEYEGRFVRFPDNPDEEDFAIIADWMKKSLCGIHGIETEENKEIDKLKVIGIEQGHE